MYHLCLSLDILYVKLLICIYEFKQIDNIIENGERGNISRTVSKIFPTSLQQKTNSTTIPISIIYSFMIYKNVIMTSYIQRVS